MNDDYQHNSTPITDCDDRRHFHFVRDSKLPHDTFKTGTRVDRDTVVFVAVLLALLLVLLFIPVPVGKVMP